MDLQKRQTAYRFWIADLLQAKVSLLQGGFSQIEVSNLPVGRVNLLATVVFRFENQDHSYVAISLDDSSGVMRVKTWREDSRLLADVHVGDVVLVVGRLRFYNGEFYVTPEVVRKMGLYWDLVRKLELTKTYGKPQPVAAVQQVAMVASEGSTVVEEVVEPTESARQRILSLIERRDAEHGADLNDVILESGLPESEAESAIEELLKEGEIYAPRPGRLKVIA